MKSLHVLLCCLVALAILSTGAFAQTDQSCQVNVDSTKGQATCVIGGDPCNTFGSALQIGLASTTCKSLIISLAPGTYSGVGNVGLVFTPTLSGSVTMVTITKNNTMSGKVIFDGAKNSQIFTITDVNYEIQISDMTFQNGAALSTTNGNGGCISYTQSKQQNLPFYLIRSTFTNCQANADGGALFVDTISYIHFIGNEFQSSKAAGNGGGVSINSQTTQYTFIEDCFFTGNTANKNGGGLYLISATANAGKPLLTSCVFTENKALNGGGLYTDSAHGTYLEFSQNTATSAGGNLAIIASQADTTRFINITQIMAAKGTAKMGGGIYIINANALIYKAEVSNNAASDLGGGIYMATTDEQHKANKIQISNSSIQVNYAKTQGGGIYCNGASSPWEGVFLQANTVDNDDSVNDDVYCDEFCISQYCSSCTCPYESFHCLSCPSGSCSYNANRECSCYLNQEQFKDTCGYPNVSKTGSPSGGLTHGARVALGLIFGLFLPLCLFVIVGFVYLRNRRNRYSGYSTLGENERLVSTW